MKILSGFGVGLLIWSPAFLYGQTSQSPNILLIQVDQLRFDCTGFGGSKIVKTPNLDQLAQQGMCFENNFTPIPTCCPARQTLLSGKWPEIHHGLWNYDITLPVEPFDAPTFTEALQKTGYVLGYVGKWHVHETKTPLDFGFNDYFSDETYSKQRKSENLPGTQALSRSIWFGGVDPAPLEKSHTHWMAGKVIGLINKYKQSGKPWHIRLDPVEPHLPCFPNQAYLDRYSADSIKPWINFNERFNNKPYIQHQQIYNWSLENTKWNEWALYLQRYFAMISQVDNAIGLVLDALEKSGEAANTLVIFTTDHGDAAGSHGMMDKHYVMYQEEVHIPLIMKWPGHITPNSRCRAFTLGGLDLSATISDICNLGFETQGQSLLPLLRGKVPGDWRRFAFSNYNGQQFGLFVQRMIFDGRYKYIWNMTDTDEFYDLQNDPGELINKIGDVALAEPLAELRAALFYDLVKRGDPVSKQAATKRQLLEGKKLLSNE